MRYENMPKGRNKDICVRCGKRANFADRLKSDVQYDLLCLAETTSSGYMTQCEAVWQVYERIAYVARCR